MKTEIRRLTTADLDASARLLAARQRADRRRAPELSARFEEPATVRPLVERALPNPSRVGWLRCWAIRWSGS
jgi:hypothetical protein